MDHAILHEKPFGIPLLSNEKQTYFSSLKVCMVEKYSIFQTSQICLALMKIRASGSKALR